ncbi:MAG: FAD-binding oxidoreductase [Proteobacteria bacterium]|nr:FAD-binding oxidoreductase [Pseudomonadota bacterium]
MSLIGKLQQIVGEAYVTTDTAGAPYLSDVRNTHTGKALALVRPGSPQEVAAVVRECAEHHAPVVVQGGNTGLMAAATPDNSGKAVLLQLSRLNRVREVDLDNDTITVEAGCILQHVQEAAQSAGRLFPLSLGAEGSCTIGGNLGTNAGGTQVLRYGNTRELTLGLEVVTAEGELWHGLRGLRKDNTGYDLRDLYIGSEGTLGIITAATLKLYPLPAAEYAGLLAFASLEDAVAFLSEARKGFGASLTGFEVIASDVLRLIATNKPQLPLPVDVWANDWAWYALVEISDEQSEAHAQEAFERVVGQGLESGLVQDAVVAEGETQRLALWHLRESGISEAQAVEGKNIKHEVSVPISRTAEFVATTVASLKRHYPGCRPILFGHLGDGNLHFNVSPPLGVSPKDFLQHEADIHELVHDSAHAFGGSISAEHGIGQVKRDVLPRYKSALELRLMRRIKQALDPLNILNPGKVLTDSRAEVITRSITAEKALS